MKMHTGKLLMEWLRARWMALAYVAVVFVCFFVVYALYGYGWGVAGYAALLALVAGAFFVIWDFARFAARHNGLYRLAGRFPTGRLPEAVSLPEKDYTAIIEALEAERARLERENDHTRRDAEEYYTLWAHQIKTPMAAMQLLLQSSPGQLDKQAKGDVEQELFRIGQYVDMVLQYQRLSSLQNDLVLQAHSLEELVKQAAKNCAPLFIYKGLALDTSGVQGSVVTDKKWFCFVLEQLFTNAVKYTPAGSVSVYSTGDDTLVMQDTGVGIPAEDLPRVFERGFTGNMGRSERSSTGIGLYLCREIMARLGFGISIRSAPKSGTRVLLHLKQQVLELE